jgi:chromosome segregation ATPase
MAKQYCNTEKRVRDPLEDVTDIIPVNKKTVLSAACSSDASIPDCNSSETALTSFASPKLINPMEELKKLKEKMEEIAEGIKNKQKEINNMLLMHKSLENEMGKIYAKTQEDKFQEYMRLEKIFSEKKLETVEIEKKNSELRNEQQQIITSLDSLRTTLFQIAQAIPPKPTN